MRGRLNLRECEQSRVEAPTRHDCCEPSTSRRTDAQPQSCSLTISFVFISACNEMAMLADTLRPKQRYQRHFQRQRGPSRHQPLPTAAYSALERCVHLEQGSINSFNKLGGRPNWRNKPHRPSSSHSHPQRRHRLQPRCCGKNSHRQHMRNCVYARARGTDIKKWKASMWLRRHWGWAAG